MCDEKGCPGVGEGCRNPFKRAFFARLIFPRPARSLDKLELVETVDEEII